MALQPKRAFAIAVKKPPGEHLDSVLHESKQRLALSDAALSKVRRAMEARPVNEQFDLEVFTSTTALLGTSLAQMQNEAA